MKIKSSEAVSQKYLQINSCGLEIINGYNAGSLRPDGRCDYHILYIAEGECSVISDNKKITVPAGSVIVYLPYQRQEYFFDGDFQSKSYYIHFAGVACDDLMQKFGMDKENMYFIGYSHSLVNLLDSLIETFRLKQPFYEETSQGILLEILSLAGRKIKEASSSVGKSAIKRIKEVCRDIYANYSKDNPIAYYAKMCNLSESRFSHAFKEFTSLSPKQYILKAKTEISKEFLKNTDLTVLQIANNVGFQSQNYFSRIFKKYTGCSPTKYRENTKIQGM